MKRKDLTRHLLNCVLDELRNNLDWKIKGMLSFSSLTIEPINFVHASFCPITQIWSYASSDADLMWKHDSLDDTGYFPSEDLQDIYQTLFGPILRLQQGASIPMWFWDTPLGFACKVAQARLLLDSFIPLSVMDVALLAGRKHTTVQQHCQRGSITAAKDGRSWKVPPIEALRYLISVKSEPFFSHYSMERYQSMLNDFLTSGDGRFIHSADKEKSLHGTTLLSG